MVTSNVLRTWHRKQSVRGWNTQTSLFAVRVKGGKERREGERVNKPPFLINTLSPFGEAISRFCFYKVFVETLTVHRYGWKFLKKKHVETNKNAGSLFCFTARHLISNTSTRREEFQEHAALTQ